jgi:hypothetical protein
VYRKYLSSILHVSLFNALIIGLDKIDYNILPQIWKQIHIRGKPAWKVQNTNERITCIGLIKWLCVLVDVNLSNIYQIALTENLKAEKYSVICVIKDHRIRRVMQCACNPSLFPTMFGRDFIIVSAIKICRSCALCLKEDVSWLWW